MSTMIQRLVRLLAAIPVFFAAQIHAAPAKQILLVLTNHADLGTSRNMTGFFLSEAAHPWQVFRNAGYEVKLASPQGGFSPVDVRSHDLKDETNKAFWETFGSGKPGRESFGVAETLALSTLNPREFAAVLFVGGHGTMWDFRDNPSVASIAASIYESGGIVGAVCHGPAALLQVKLSDGTLLVAGKTVAAFSNQEESAVKLDKVVPFSLQTELEKAGAKFSSGEKFKENAVRDGRLVTGQNPSSATRTAELMVEALK